MSVSGVTWKISLTQEKGSRNQKAVAQIRQKNCSQTNHLPLHLRHRQVGRKPGAGTATPEQKPHHDYDQGSKISSAPSHSAEGPVDTWAVNKLHGRPILQRMPQQHPKPISFWLTVAIRHNFVLPQEGVWNSRQV